MINIDERGWTDSQFDLLKVQVLDIVEDNCEEGIVLVPPLAKHLTTDDRLVTNVVVSLAADGLVKTPPNAGDLADMAFATTTPAGVSRVQTRRERRSSTKQRSMACRDALLDWCYGKNSPILDSFAADTRAHFEGDPFTPEEFHTASQDLKDKGLVSGPGAWGAGIVRPQITAKGKTVVENYGSSITAYETRHQASPSQQTIVRFEGGSYSGQIAIGNRNQLTQNNGSGDPELGRLVQAVLDAARGTNEEERVGKLIAQLQLEVEEAEPEPSILRRILDRLRQLALKAGNSALTASTTQLVDHAMKALGVG